MSLADCIIATSSETIDPTLTVGTVVFTAQAIASPTSIAPAIDGSWTVPANAYFQGVQFDYGPTDGTFGRVLTSVQRTSPWSTSASVIGGQTYSIRYRAAGIPGLFGPWTTYQNLFVPVPAAVVPDTPGAGAWSAVGTAITGGGSSFPAIHIAGALDQTNGVVTDLIVEIAPHGTTGWKTFGHFPINATSIDVTAVGATVLYDVAISYDNSGSIGPRLVLDNAGAGYAAGGFVASGGTTVVTPAALEWPDATASGAGTQSASMAAQTFATINVPITLALTFTGSATWTYQKNGASTAFASGDHVTVSAGDALGFTASSAASTSGALTITNLTDSSAVLDAPLYSLTVTGSTVTPSPTPSWMDISEDSYGGQPVYGYTDSRSIAGINTAITLTITITGTASIAYQKNSDSYVGISSGGTISISNTDSLAFRAAKSGVGSSSGTIVVANSSDGGAVLHTISYRVAVHSGPAP